MQECNSARVQECKSARVQECKGARVHECKSARVQVCKCARVQEWVQEWVCVGVCVWGGLRCASANGKMAFICKCDWRHSWNPSLHGWQYAISHNVQNTSRSDVHATPVRPNAPVGVGRGFDSCKKIYTFQPTRVGLALAGVLSRVGGVKWESPHGLRDS